MVLDVSIDLHADERSVTLDLLRGDPGGFGIHYSGLALRLNDAMTPGELLDADGRTETADVYGNASRWCGFAGRHAEDGQVYGVTMIDHPENPHYPTRWWVRNGLEYGLLHPSPCFDEPLELEAGESVTLRYRIVLHKGPVRVCARPHRGGGGLVVDGLARQGGIDHRTVSFSRSTTLSATAARVRHDSSLCPAGAASGLPLLVASSTSSAPIS